MTRLRRLWRRVAYCRRGEHRETPVCVFGELRMVCLDCPWARTLGHVFLHASNKRRATWEQPDA